MATNENTDGTTTPPEVVSAETTPVYEAVVVEQAEAEAEAENGTVETAEIVDEPYVPGSYGDTEVVAPVTAVPAPTPGYVEPQQVVYVQTPHPPRRKGNRTIGVLIAVASALVYVILFAVAVVAIASALGGRVSLTFLSAPQFYLPVLFFLIGFVILVLVVNRGGWWAYVIGSILVALFVYFGATGAILLGRGIILETPSAATELFRLGLTSPVTIAAALLAREVSLWAGAAISWRGRRVKIRNTEARAAFDAEQDEQNA